MTQEILLNMSFDHRFNCNSPLCSCDQRSESTVHFSLHCQLYIDMRGVLLDSVSEIIFNDVRVYPDQHMCQIFLYGSESFNSVENRIILQSTVTYINLKIQSLNVIQRPYHNL